MQANAFNSINHQVYALTILIHTYRGNAPLFIDGKHLFLSEGITTQGIQLLWLCIYH